MEPPHTRPGPFRPPLLAADAFGHSNGRYRLSLTTVTCSGHPGCSALAAFENFAARAISAVQDNAKMWRSTAIFVTFDESGGYYDSGYIQPVSFFGDGPRVPMLVVSPYARRDFIDHTYTDHVSILKFIEANWRLKPLTSYSEDNLPNATPGVYVPHNRPAIGNLMTMFNFRHPDFATIKLKRRPARPYGPGTQPGPYGHYPLRVGTSI
jgi:phospholipase C